MRRAVLRLMDWMGKRAPGSARILADVDLCPSKPVKNPHPAWKVRQASSTTTFLKQTSMRRRRQCSMKMGLWMRTHRWMGSGLRVLEAPRELLTAPPQRLIPQAPSDLAQEMNSTTALIQIQAEC